MAFASAEDDDELMKYSECMFGSTLLSAPPFSVEERVEQSRGALKETRELRMLYEEKMRQV